MLERAVRALARQDYDPGKIDLFIIDNASTDGTPDFVIELCSPERVVDNPTEHAHEPHFRVAEAGQRNRLGLRSVTLVRNTNNLGGCGGFNTAFGAVEHVLGPSGEAGAPDYLWLADDDADWPADALRNLVRTAESDRTIGLVGSRAVNDNDRQDTFETTIYFDREQGIMSDKPEPGHRFEQQHKEWLARVGATKGRGQFSGACDVDVVSACSMLARWSATRDVGFWDYRYFIYCDDADWCLRFARAGYRVVCEASAVVYHTPWFSKLTPVRQYYAQRNILWVLQKQLPARQLRKATMMWTLRMLRDCAAMSLHRRLFHAEVIRRACNDAATNHGGKLTFNPPDPEATTEAIRRLKLGAPGRPIALLCPDAGTLNMAREFVRIVRSDPTTAGAEFVLIAHNSIPEGDARSFRAELGLSREPVIYSSRRRSRIARNVKLFARAPGSCVVFAQHNTFPLVLGRWNLHVDAGAPAKVRVEDGGLPARAALWTRIALTACRTIFHAATVRPYTSPTRFG